ncbi:MAG: hypothetical protein JWQ66_235 [Mucilaginibacter sp.]|nr:hypothetical protein [Mucilaginibacter sp.]
MFGIVTVINVNKAQFILYQQVNNLEQRLK